jgi:hypothetical protein
MPRIAASAPPGFSAAVDMQQSGLRFGGMSFRLLALLLALVVVAGVAAPTVAASPDVVGLVDDGVDGASGLESAMTAVAVVLDMPGRGQLGQIIVLPTDSQGRLHRVWVFRPPRQLASR